MSRASSGTADDLTLFLVAGEHSGDALGGKLMAEINRRHRRRVRYLGVGGEAMAREGLISLFPLDELAVMGPAAILARLPRLVRRVYGTVAAVEAARPDALVIIDSPEFTHAVARRVRRRSPHVPIIDYVSPSVWAWRPGRARKMRRYIDHILALLPFEPEAHRRLGGPPCTYVGHPLIERLPELAAIDTTPLARRLRLSPQRPLLVVLPGSRRSEVKYLLQPFGEAIAGLLARGLDFEIAVPVVPHVRALVEAGIKTWPRQPLLLDGEQDKFAAFRLARAALAASGTVTLELALAGAPMVVGYKVDPVAAVPLRRMIKASSVVLPSLILGDEQIFPEFHQEACTGEALAAALAPLFHDTPERKRQLRAIAELPRYLQLPHGTPSEAAADVVLRYAVAGRTLEP